MKCKKVDMYLLMWKASSIFLSPTELQPATISSENKNPMPYGLLHQSSCTWEGSALWRPKPLLHWLLYCRQKTEIGSNEFQTYLVLYPACRSNVISAPSPQGWSCCQFDYFCNAWSCQACQCTWELSKRRQQDWLPYSPIIQRTLSRRLRSMSLIITSKTPDSLRAFIFQCTYLCAKQVSFSRLPAWKGVNKFVSKFLTSRDVRA